MTLLERLKSAASDPLTDKVILTRAELQQLLKEIQERK